MDDEGYGIFDTCPQTQMVLKIPMYLKQILMDMVELVGITNYEDADTDPTTK